MELRQLHRIPRERRDTEWIRQRRSCQAILRAKMRERKLQLRRCGNVFGEALLALSQEFGDVWDEVQLGDQARECMGDVSDAESSAEEDEETPPFPRVALGFEPRQNETPAQRYRRFFSEAAGRRQGDGPPGASSLQPTISPEMQAWTDKEWAQWWIHLGGLHHRGACRQRQLDAVAPCRPGDGALGACVQNRHGPH